MPRKGRGQLGFRGKWPLKFPLLLSATFAFLNVGSIFLTDDELSP